MRALRRLPVILLAALLLSSCAVSISFDGVSLGGRRTVRAAGEVQHSIDLLLFAEEAGDHVLSIEGIHFTDGGIELTVDPALEDNITLSAPERVLDSVKVSIDHQRGVIAVRGNEKLQFAGGELEITLGVPLKSLSVQGGAELDASLPEVTAFSLDVDGAIDGEIDFGRLDSLDVTVNGAGSLELSGVCARAAITVNGAGSIEADDLVCTAAAVEINGAGSCEIHVTDTLDAAVSGIGAIRYSGDPATVNRSGGGIVSVDRD